MRPLALVLGGALLLAGCKMGPDYVRPDTSQLEQLRRPSTSEESIANVPWWELYGDPVLRDLIAAALQGNRGLRVTLARIRQARLAAANARSYLAPTLTLGASGQVSEGVTLDGDRVSDRTVTGVIDMSYELDLWGRIRRSDEAAFAELLATEEAYRSVTISLVASVADLYFTLLDLDNRQWVTVATIEQRLEGMETVRSRYLGGFTNEVDYRQAEILLREAEAAGANQRRLIVETENALSILVGHPPASVVLGRPLFEQVTPPEVPVGLASDIVRRRPDIRQAELLLHAQTARIGVAEASRFPRFVLTGPSGVTAALTSPSLTTFFASFGLDIASALFNAGRNRRQVEIEVARTDALLAQYEQTILTAFAEVEDALIGIETYQAQVEARQLQVEAARAASEVAWSRYSGGLTTYLEVINIQNSLFTAQIGLSSVRRGYLSSIVNLYKALGGGWPVAEEANDPDAPSAEDAPDRELREEESNAGR